MASKEDLYKIGQEGFEAIDIFFGHNSTARTPQLHRNLYHRNEVPLETVPSPYLVYQRTEVSQVPQQVFSSPPPPEPPRSFQFGRFFPVKPRNPPKRMAERRGFPPLGPYRFQYPPWEQHERGQEGRVPAAEPASMNNFKAAQLFGGATRVDYGWF